MGHIKAIHPSWTIDVGWTEMELLMLPYTVKWRNKKVGVGWRALAQFKKAMVSVDSFVPLGHDNRRLQGDVGCIRP